MLYEFKGHRPAVDPSSFIHPQAVVTGNVSIGRNVYIGPGAAIRGDWGRIVIEDGCNVQESCTIHMFPGVTVWLKEGAHIGHGAIVHGAVIGRNCLIGMNSVIMDNVEIGDECIVGALSFIKAGEKIPGRSVVAGNPARILKEVSDEMLRWKTEGTALYQALPGEMRESWGPVEEGGAEWRRRWGITEYIHQGDHPDIKPYKPWKNASEEPKANIVKEPEAEDGQRHFSIQDYLYLEEGSNNKHEYYEGTIFAMAGAKPEHNKIVFNVTRSMILQMQGKSCNVLGSDQRVHVPANSFFTYPDLTIVCDQPTFYTDKMSLTNPSVIIEVLSPTTKDYDRTTKFRLYQDVPTFQEYILIDSRSVLVEHHYKNANGEWICQTWDQFTDHLAIKIAGVTLLLSDIYKSTGLLAAKH
ncbi:MAG TPA: Uma2 family endonuclease [Puia sp.]|jgi:phenylacetic acid degradation protein/carnitine operon protein CaiE|nr:Uma2 family endonuclease [Puia sp.]